MKGCDILDFTLPFDELNILYFQGMDLSEREQNQRIEKSEELHERIGLFLDMQKEVCQSDPAMFAFLSDMYLSQLESLYRDVFDSNDNWVNERAKTFSNEIQRATQDYVEQGKAENAFSEERKSKISINESNMYWNYDRHRRLSSVYAYHTWLSERDDRVRPTHITADGQRVPVDEPFWVGGYRMMYPTDSSLGAGPEEIVNCRCVEIFS